MADCDCMADADREWLLYNLPDATENEQDWFVMKVAWLSCDMDLSDKESRRRSLQMIEDARLISGTTYKSVVPFPETKRDFWVRE